MGWKDRRRREADVRSRWLPGYWLRHPLTGVLVSLLAMALFVYWAIDSADWVALVIATLLGPGLLVVLWRWWSLFRDNAEAWREPK